MSLNSPVFMTAKEVGNFLKTYMFNNRSQASRESVFSQIETRLSNDMVACERQEIKAYQVFGVDNLSQLQIKINEINNSGLTSFSARAYNASNLHSQLKTSTNLEFNEAVNEEINKLLMQSMNTEGIIDETSINIVNEQIQRMFNEKHDLPLDKKHNIRIKGKIRNVASGKNDTNFATKSHYAMFEAIIDQKNLTQTGSTWSASIKISEDVMTNTENGLNFYPYFRLTENEKQLALSPDWARVWNNFKLHLKSFIQDDNIQKCLEVALNTMGIASFFQETESGVKGVLGELQMMTIAAALTDMKRVRYVANEMKNGQKLATDIILDSMLGIQVKNYTGYLTNQHEQGYNINKTYKWNDTGGMANILLANLDPSIVTTLGTYFATCSYNKPISDATETYQNMYKHMALRSGPVYTTTQEFLSQQIGTFLTLPQAEALIVGDQAEGQELLNSPDFFNVFYYISGTIIPASHIYQALLNRVKYIKELLNSGQRGRTYGFTVTPTEGPTHWSWDQADPATNTLTIEQILNEMSFKINMNLYLPELNLTFK